MGMRRSSATGSASSRSEALQRYARGVPAFQGAKTQRFGESVASPGNVIGREESAAAVHAEHVTLASLSQRRLAARSVTAGLGAQPPSKPGPLKGHRLFTACRVSSSA